MQWHRKSPMGVLSLQLLACKFLMPFFWQDPLLLIFYAHHASIRVQMILIGSAGDLNCEIACCSEYPSADIMHVQSHSSLFPRCDRSSYQQGRSSAWRAAATTAPTSTLSWHETSSAPWSGCSPIPPLLASPSCSRAKPTPSALPPCAPKVRYLVY